SADWLQSGKCVFFFSSRRRHTRFSRDWSSDVCSSDLWLTDEEQRTWRQFVWSTRLLFEALDRQLQRDSGLPHSYYLILAMLSEAPDRTLSMGELAEVVRSSPSRLSHAVARLEEAGWVRRRKRPGDRRSTLAQLTDQGYDVLAAAAP